MLSLCVEILLHDLLSVLTFVLPPPIPLAMPLFCAAHGPCSSLCLFLFLFLSLILLFSSQLRILLLSLLMSSLPLFPAPMQTSHDAFTHDHSRQGEPSCSAYASEGLGGQAEGTLTSIEEAENSQVVSGVPQETTEEQQDGSVAAPRPALSPAESTKETAEKQSEPLRERGPMYCYTRERWSPQKRQFCCRTYGLGC